MASDTPAAPVPLTYEAGVSRQRLPDGSLRITVVTRRNRAMMVISAAAGAAVAAAAVVYLLGLPFRWALMGFVALPLCLASLLVTLTTPKHQTHVVEVGPAGLRVQTTVTGDRVDRFHPRAEILSVRALGTAIQIRTTRDFYQSIAFGDPGVLKDVAATINRELGATGSATA